MLFRYPVGMKLSGYFGIIAAILVFTGARLWADEPVEIVINDFRNRSQWDTLDAGQVPKPMTGPKNDVPGMALPCQFKKVGIRASWAWNFKPRDLSAVSFFSMWFYCEDWTLLKGFTLYLQSGDGWLVNFNVSVRPMNGWQQIIIPKGSFGVEGIPVGWKHVNGVKISLWNSAPRNGRFGIAAWTATSGYANLLLNSGFEYCSKPGLPDGWGEGHWGLYEPWPSDPEGFRRHWLMEAGGSPKGKRCMRLNGDSKLQPQLVSLWHSLAAGQDYTLSCLLKSSEEDYPVHLSFSPGGGGTVKVDTAWRRYRQTFRAASSAMGMVYIRGEKHGSLWIDDVQLEEGSQETRWTESPLDRALSKPLPPARALPRLEGTASPWQQIRRTEVDTKGIFRVNGKAHIPFAPIFSAFSSAPVSRATLQTAARNGIRSVLLHVCGKEWAKVFPQLLKYCSELQLAAIVWLDVDDKGLEEAISNYKTHPAILAWMVADEPVGDLTPIKARVRRAKEIDPNHCVFVNYAAGVDASFGDVVSIDFYPIPFSGPETVGPVVEAQAAVTAKVRKPLWFILQTIGYHCYVPREPTAEEEEAMTYLALLGGARGLMHFWNRPYGDRLWLRMGSLAYEVEKLTPVLTEGKKVDLSLKPESPVKAQAYRLGKDLYVISVNASDSPCRAGLRIANARFVARARVLFEDRKKKVIRGMINEKFAAYERHVFFLPGWYR